MDHQTAEAVIRGLVRTAVQSYAAGFQDRHEGEVEDPDGTINMKIHNVFIAALGPEVQYYTSLVRSLDSSLGNMLEGLAKNIAKASFSVRQEVEGPLSAEQTQRIAELLESYKSRRGHPGVADYQCLRDVSVPAGSGSARHGTDYYLVNENTGRHYLIELKIGGDLDNKKARSEKEALLEQFAILSNTLPRETPITVHFATAYNRYGEGSPWQQQRVRQYFADEELLIGSAFWDLVCQSESGYDMVLDEYRENAHYIITALESIKRTYLGEEASRD